ncbi:MAG: GNAT family N-acetyltransferase [Leptolyngbyaceae bacterium]|nr:GNAT family N-acetyltransferase [Leptolyngbyaceae bacterium]
MRLDRSTILIRDAQLSDIPVLSVLLVDSFNPELEEGIGRWFQPLLRLSIQTDLQQRFRMHHHQTKQYCCIVAVCSQPLGQADTGERIIGTVEMSQKYHYVWPAAPQCYPYIANLAVQSRYRRQGIAASLLRACEAVAIQWGFSNLQLHVREDNQAARHLYEQEGYRIQRVDFNLGTLIWQQPRTLLLCKQLRIERA